MGWSGVTRCYKSSINWRGDSKEGLKKHQEIFNNKIMSFKLVVGLMASSKLSAHAVFELIKKT